MKICIFAYNFKHKKTQEGIIRLFCSKFKINQVIAMNKIKINSPKKIIELTSRDINYIRPKQICKSLKIPYNIINHNSKKCLRYIKKKNFDLGIILGARILDKEIIDCFKVGILNLHPGLLPENRGLDTHQWSILNMFPQGATAHLIDNRMDCGKIIIKKKIKIYKQDTMKDFYLRIQSLELDLMIRSLEVITKKKNYGHNPKKQGKYHSYISATDELKVKKLFENYKKKFV
jgi:folate-dependent phosphoribosylglycinamide formyltransferase PurN